MSIGDIFWLFFMFTALQPVLRQRMMDAMRTRKIARLESQRNSRVILLVHRQETMRLLGFRLRATSTLTTQKRCCGQSR
jgi:hypothetical protein